MDTYPSFESSLCLKSSTGSTGWGTTQQTRFVLYRLIRTTLVDSIASAGADGRRPEAEVAII
ncbi:hypothetical protein CERSUDRAFT_101368 [Gelatoporia subvermispora B]|uniref:Uncharacterized protein n=1 Tax=Ceriporiopsis subvermispora (strain B) TaxID=914234 RepID=M2QEM7_CERS8|nr:hypothetical protein CERSUDRAFT_101368 [Gelatoporia subvermispora B]